MSDVGDFFSRLRERQVIKTLVLYVAVGWGFYEIASEVLARFGFPDTYITLLLLFLLLGLPAALFLAWYFDVDRRGIHREGPMQGRDKAIIVAALLLPVVSVIVAKPLTGGAPSSGAATNTVAVLPFNNFTGDASLEYLADGVAEEIIASLTGLHTLEVSAWTQSFRYRGAELDPMQVGHELDVAWVVRGSVRSSGPLLRFSASVVDVRHGTSVWSDSTDVGKLAVFGGQDELSRAVARALASEIGIEVPAIDDVAAPDPEAYDLYLRGRHIWHRRGTREIDTGINMLAEATRLDPNFARGWAALASAYLTWPNYSSAGYGTWSSSEDLALKAIELDPTLPEPYAVIGSHLQYRQQWLEALNFFEESLRLDHNNATAHYWYGEHLASTGRYADSVRHMRRAIELDPAYEAPLADIGLAYLAMQAYAEGSTKLAEAWASGMRSPVSWMGNFIARIVTGRVDEARSWVADAPLNDDGKALLGRFVDVEDGAADATLADELFTTAIDYKFKIWLLSRLGDYDAAMELVDALLDSGRPVDPRPLWGIGIELYRHPDFPPLMERLGLVEYWRAAAWGDVCRPLADAFICDGHGLTPEALAAVLEQEF